VIVEAHLRDTQRAFDSVASVYDGAVGNNAVIQRMRGQMWWAITETFPSGSQLLDLGCGAGIDTVFLASRGYSVLAIDWSEEMVERTRQRVAEAGLAGRAHVLALGVQELSQLRGERFDGIYSDLGPLNCIPALPSTARDCAVLLLPGGRIIASVIGRICPWETVYHAARGNWRRAVLRGSRRFVPVPLNGETVWTHYYTPREFYRSFAGEFALTSYRGLGIFSPPPYLIRVWECSPALCNALAEGDDRLGALPLIRNLGDHFLMMMTKRSQS
jgi:SAM-dependent methyltransferase